MNGSGDRNATGPRSRWRVVGLAILVVTAALGGAVLAGLPPDLRDLSLRIAIVVAGIAGSWWVLGRSSTFTQSTPERFEGDLVRPRSEPSEVARLRELDTAIRMAVASDFGVETMLKPRLRELAAWRLMASRGVDLARQPDAARKLLGERLWRITGAPPSAAETRAKGVPLAEIRAAIADLEGL